MCRSIKRLREGSTPASEEEIRAAARQFVRKISGFSAPASHNEATFEAAVSEIARSSQKLLGSLQVRNARSSSGLSRPAPPRRASRTSRPARAR